MGKYKKFIVEALEGKHPSISEECKELFRKEFPELVKGEWKEGMWLISDEEELVRFKEYENKEKSYFNYSEIYNSTYSLEGYFNCEYFTPATEDQIFKILKEEAIKRKVWDVPVKCLYSENINRTGNLAKLYCIEEDALWSKYGCVYEKGKWATPIKQIRKELQNLLDKYKLGKDEIIKLLK